jgi:hypothetical protein
VRTCADEGKSDLRLDGRDGLKQVIIDVETGRADFSTILVYDVSRCGHFQDAAESAYHEYICRRAGAIADVPKLDAADGYIDNAYRKADHGSGSRRDASRPERRLRRRRL